MMQVWLQKIRLSNYNLEFTCNISQQDITSNKWQATVLIPQILNTIYSVQSWINIQM